MSATSRDTSVFKQDMYLAVKSGFWCAFMLNIILIVINVSFVLLFLMYQFYSRHLESLIEVEPNASSLCAAKKTPCGVWETISIVCDC